MSLALIAPPQPIAPRASRCPGEKDAPLPSSTPSRSCCSRSQNGPSCRALPPLLCGEAALQNPRAPAVFTMVLKGTSTTEAPGSLSGMSSSVDNHRGSEQTDITRSSDDNMGTFEFNQTTKSSRLCDTVGQVLRDAAGRVGWLLLAPQRAILAALAMVLMLVYRSNLVSSTLAFLGLAGVLAILAWMLCYRPRTDTAKDSEKGTRLFRRRYCLAAVIAVSSICIKAMSTNYWAVELLEADVSCHTLGNPGQNCSIIPPSSWLSTIEKVHNLKLVAAAVLAGAALYMLRTRTRRIYARTMFSALSAEAGMDAAGAAPTSPCSIPASNSEL
eukprot:3658960-Pleurochrysis_carterae.AAC.1